MISMMMSKDTAGHDVGNELGAASWVVIRWSLVFLGSGVMEMK